MSNFFKRWSQLKQVQTSTKEQESNPTVEVKIDQASVTPAPENSAEQLAVDQGPTMADVEKLNPDSDFSGFASAGVKDDVHHAAMKKLFSDPHYNVMDGLDIYIDDYSKEDPLPPGMLEKMVQSSMLGLFKKLEEEPSVSPTDHPTIQVPEDSEIQTKTEEIHLDNQPELTEKENLIKGTKNV
jgi:hypothetical protein